MVSFHFLGSVGLVRGQTGVWRCWRGVVSFILEGRCPLLTIYIITNSTNK